MLDNAATGVFFVSEKMKNTNVITSTVTGSIADVIKRKTEKGVQKTGLPSNMMKTVSNILFPEKTSAEIK
ncbi:hypothetical protein IKP13_06910 [bacterium]|nr:hypothetical protein [bacterium]